MRFSFRSLSFRLLLLTVFFVMLAEVLIYTPSVARFRQVYLTEKLDSAHLAAMAVNVAPDRMVSEEITYELLDHVNAWSIEVVRDGVSMEMLKRPLHPEPQVRYNLDTASVVTLIVNAFDALFQTRNRVLQISGIAPKDPMAVVVVTLDEYPLRRAMYDYSWRILNLSIFISVITAALMFVSLRWLMVRPLERLTRSLIAFRRSPEDRASDLIDLGRRDEIGVALREMAAMKEGMRGALRQRTRLAALGTAVNKISHDLRNMLSTATLISDRLAMSQDPEVQRITPTLVKAIDRAAALCSTTLNFTRETPPLRLESATLAKLLRDVEAGLPASELGALRIHVVDGGALTVRVDRDQMFRALANLIGNAAGAGAGRVTVTAVHRNRQVIVDVADDGPGIPQEGLGKLFQPFQYSTRKDGTGLGLTIARDIIQAHGGRLTLDRTGPDGTVFRIELPEAGR
ncbi:periplasmic sensor signal transduction histidine kinase [alpha proteobacterium BAL199]|nr:periplasmic sensor signal transduction histidine kinase [alpha proteobacterium BAL199]